jgi:protein deglycase
MINIIVPLANGFEEMEALVPVDVWRRAGFEVTMMSISEELIVTGSHQISVLADSLFNKTKAEEADMIFLPGGMPGAKNLSQHIELRKLINTFHEKEKVLAAICAAPLVFGQNNILVNRRATCFPGFEDQLLGANVTQKTIETDGHIITAKGAGVAFDFALAIVSRFKGEEEARDIAAKMQVKKHSI